MSGKVQKITNKVSGTINKVTSKLTNIPMFQNISKTQAIIWISVLITFILAAIFVYVNYIKPQIIDTVYKTNYEFDKTIKTDLELGSDIKKDINVYLFWACWCPNSNENGTQGIKLHGIWNKLTKMSQQEKKEEFGNNITFHRVEETADDFKDKLKSIGISKIEGFPSIYISYKQYLQETDQTIVCEFDALPNEKNITDFIKDNLKSQKVSKMCKKKPTETN
jgi:hypothetical protein